MVNLLSLIVFAYSSLYAYEAPTFCGITSLFAEQIWFSSSLLSKSPYKRALTISGILPYSSNEVKHASIDAFQRTKNFTIYGGIKHRFLKDIYQENQLLVGISSHRESLNLALALRVINLVLNGETPLTKASGDMSFSYFRHPFIASVNFYNILRTPLDFSRTEAKSSIGERLLLTLNFPEGVFFTGGYEKDNNYETFIMSSEIWFTHGFNVTFGIENHTIEGGITLKSKRFGLQFRIKSHTMLGATYITQISYYKE